MDRKEAIEIVRKNYPHVGFSGSEFETALRELVPEFKEQPDPRHSLIEFIKWSCDRGSITPEQRKNVDFWLAYLERQKDQDVKVISWREPDDCADIPEGHYVVIAYKPGVFGLGYIGNGKVVCAPGQKPSGILYIPNADESIIVESKEQQPAEYIKRNSKEWYSLLAEQWDKGFWKGKAEQKPAEWSEEDEKILKDCIDMPYCADFISSERKKDAIRWLKSLRPQPHWKPSKEQMEVDLEKFTEKIKTFQGRYKYPEIVSIKDAMAFMARMFYQYPNAARQWYDRLPKTTMN